MNGNMLQVIFMAMLFGITINGLGEKGRPLAVFVKLMNDFCIAVIRSIVRFIPLVAYLSMATLMFKVGSEILFAVIMAFAAQGAALILMLAAYSGLIMCLGRISPKPFLAKIIRFLPIPATLASTNATMPFSLELCVNKLGIKSSLAAFTIPIGASLKMDGNCTFFILQGMMLSVMYGAEFTPGYLMTLILTSMVLTLGSSGVAGGAIICLVSLAATLGIPIEAVGLSIAIDPLISMLRTPLNTVSGIAAVMLIAKGEGMLDKDIYLKAS